MDELNGMQNNNLIHIAFGIHDISGDYSRHLGATIASILENTQQRVKIHLLHDKTLTEDNKSKFIQLVESFSQEIQLYEIDMRLNIKKTNTFQANTIGTFFRLRLPELLVTEKKVIYFDCDIICTLDVIDLWKENFEGFPIAVVKDSDTYINLAKEHVFYKECSILNENYFNAGVLILNLSMIREKYDLYNLCIEFLLKRPKAPCLDQDALNYIFQDKCFFLNGRYNKIADDVYRIKGKLLYSSDESWQGYCWHFAGAEKPWFSKKYPVFKLYWKYLSITPWANTIDKIVEYLYQIEDDSLDKILLIHRIGSRKLFVKNVFVRAFMEFKKMIIRRMK